MKKSFRNSEEDINSVVYRVHFLREQAPFVFENRGHSEIFEMRVLLTYELKKFGRVNQRFRCNARRVKAISTENT
jgi:hypothetical protein